MVVPAWSSAQSRSHVSQGPKPNNRDTSRKVTEVLSRLALTPGADRRVISLFGLAIRNPRGFEAVSGLEQPASAGSFRLSTDLRSLRPLLCGWCHDRWVWANLCCKRRRRCPSPYSTTGSSFTSRVPKPARGIARGDPLHRRLRRFRRLHRRSDCYRLERRELPSGSYTR